MVALAVAVDVVGGGLDGDALLGGGHAHAGGGQSCQKHKGLHIVCFVSFSQSSDVFSAKSLLELMLCPWKQAAYIDLRSVKLSFLCVLSRPFILGLASAPSTFSVFTCNLGIFERSAQTTRKGKEKEGADNARTYRHSSVSVSLSLSVSAYLVLPIKL